MGSVDSDQQKEHVKAESIAAQQQTNSSCSLTSSGCDNDRRPSFNQQLPLIPLENLKAISQICNDTGYQIYQENGQRKFCSPDRSLDERPEKGCEVFIGKIPRDCFEDELVPVLSSAGNIFELRLMMDFSGTTRGFGFVSYFNSHDAARSVNELNGHEIRPGKRIGVCLSIDNCRLFIGGIPKTKTKSEILEEMSKITDNVVDVIVYPSVGDKMKNRGFAFVEYKTHRDAAMARRRLIPGKISLWGYSVAVDWAEPELDVPKSVMSTVKILYVRNLMLTTSEDTLRSLFSEAGGCLDQNGIERVKKLKDFAFIHFAERENALKAMKVLDNTIIDGSKVEVTLAKPVDKASYYYNRFNRNNGGHSNSSGQMYPPSVRHFNQIMQHNPECYSHLINPNFIPDTSTKQADNMPPGIIGPNFDDVYSNSTIQNNLLFVNPQEIEPQIQYPEQNFNNNANCFSCVQLLEDICFANSWSLPIYQITICNPVDTGVLYSFTVSIPGIENSFSSEALNEVGCGPTGIFTPKEFSTGLEEAKELCAGYIISCLDVLSQKNSGSCRINDNAPFEVATDNKLHTNSKNLNLNKILSSLDQSNESNHSDSNIKNKKPIKTHHEERKIVKQYSFQRKIYAKEGLTKN